MNITSLSREDQSRLEMACRGHISLNAAQIEKEYQEGKIKESTSDFNKETEQKIKSYEVCSEKLKKFEKSEQLRDLRISFIAFLILTPLGLYITAKASLIVGSVILLSATISLVIFLRLFCKKMILQDKCNKAWQELRTEMEAIHIAECRKLCIDRCKILGGKKKTELLVVRQIIRSFILHGNSIYAVNQFDTTFVSKSADSPEPSDDALSFAQEEIQKAKRQVNQIVLIRRLMGE